MSNPLLLLWRRLVEPEPQPDPGQPHPTDPSGALAGPDSAQAVFLVLRRMRVPLIVLVVVFSISVAGLAVIPGEQPDGGRTPLTPFEAFYFMTYTATTIGFGEIPYPLTTPQRVWVTLSIYVAVIAWAYAIGTLLALLQDRSFRRELASQRFARQVRRMAEPFWILAGFGEAGSRVARELDRHGLRLVVLDRSADRIDAVDLAALRADVPALAATARSLPALQLAGLAHPRCAGVLALTDDDEANVTIVQAAHLLRPDLPVLARANARATIARMAAFGRPTVVDPFDAFGDRLGLALRTPALAQLYQWLVNPPGAPLPPRPAPPVTGRWIVVGHGESASEVVADLTAAGLDVVRVDPVGRRPAERSGAEPSSTVLARTDPVRGEAAGTDPARGEAPIDQAAEGPYFAGLVPGAVALVAAADRDTLNVAYVQAARRIDPTLYVVARQSSPDSGVLFDALRPDLVFVPAEVVAREVLERLANPALWDFLTLARAQGDDWAANALDHLVATCGPASPTVWQLPVDRTRTPALARRLADEPIRIGALMASPFARSEPLPLAVLAVRRGPQTHLLPGPDLELIGGDVLLMAGGAGARTAWDATTGEDEMLSYVLSGRSVATTWWGRRVLRNRR